MEPVPNRSLSDLLGALGDLLKEQFDTTKNELDVGFPRPLFDGLFLRG